jgi:nitroreductase
MPSAIVLLGMSRNSSKAGGRTLSPRVEIRRREKFRVTPRVPSADNPLREIDMASAPSSSSGTADPRQAFARMLQFRHACKVFDEARPVVRADLDYILDAGRLAPSSLGLEPWRFIVVEDRALRRHLRPACWNQSQITTGSAVIVIQALKAELAPETGYARTMLRRLAASDSGVDEAMQIYQQIVPGDLVAWSVAQCHIAASHMMLAAAAIGIDSCPMGGFEPEAVAEVLKIDRARFEVALLVAVGYRAQDQPARHRLPLDRLVEYR